MHALARHDGTAQQAFWASTHLRVDWLRVKLPIARLLTNLDTFWLLSFPS